MAPCASICVSAVKETHPLNSACVRTRVCARTNADVVQVGRPLPESTRHDAPLLFGCTQAHTCGCRVCVCVCICGVSPYLCSTSCALPSSNNLLPTSTLCPLVARTGCCRDLSHTHTRSLTHARTHTESAVATQACSLPVDGCVC